MIVTCQYLQFRFSVIKLIKNRHNYFHSKTQRCAKGCKFPLSALVREEKLWNSLSSRKLSSGINEAKIYKHGSRLEVEAPRWPKPINLSYVWLRDHCRCNECYNHSTFQRRKNITEINLNIKPIDVTWDDKMLSITWPDGHSSKYDFKFLWQSTYEGQKDALSNCSPITWTKMSFPALDLVTVSVDDFLESKKGKAKLVEAVLKYGFGFISKVSPTREATKDVIEAFCPVKKTFYGEMWSVSTDVELADTAYSTETLGAHTDSTYFTAAPRIQVFHCLKSADEGGETLLVDGFGIAEQLQKSAPDSYEFLSSVPVPSEYRGDDQHHVCLDVVFKHHPVNKKLLQFRYNIYDRAPLSSIPFQRVNDYYFHLQKLASIIRQPANEVWLNLQPGSILFMDNWRVMHGRNQFKGQRFLEGCYIDNIDFTSKARTLGFFVN